MLQREGNIIDWIRKDTIFMGWSCGLGCSEGWLCCGLGIERKRKWYILGGERERLNGGRGNFGGRWCRLLSVAEDLEDKITVHWLIWQGRATPIHSLTGPREIQLVCNRRIPLS